MSWLFAVYLLVSMAEPTLPVAMDQRRAEVELPCCARGTSWQLLSGGVAGGQRTGFVDQISVGQPVMRCLSANLMFLHGPYSPSVPRGRPDQKGRAVSTPVIEAVLTVTPGSLRLPPP